MRHFLLFFLLLITTVAFGQDYYMFVGTYTTGKSAGIYVYRFHSATGKAEKISTISTKNPSYLDIASNGKYVYSVNETGDAHTPGQVSAFAFNSSTGRLHLINQVSSGGGDPCYVTTSKNGRWVVVANYNGGNLSAFRVRSDGSVDSLSQVVQHTGSSINKDRQGEPHAHSVVFSPDGQYLFCADLGTDKEMIYRFDSSSATPLAGVADSFINILPGSGPRHFVFHPSKPNAYLIEELSGTIDAYHYEDGHLINFQHISTHPDTYIGNKGSADIHITPNGKFLYASNRGDANSLAIYTINAETGKLVSKGFQKTLGNTPRNFTIDPTGKFLLVANQNSSNVVEFAINPQTGSLHPTGVQFNIPEPVCIKMVKIH